MASSIDKATLMGHVGQDPELRYNGQIPVCKFTLATSKSWIDKKNNERKDQVNWHRITVFGARAEIVNKFVSKGSFVYLEGEIRNSSFEKDGKKIYISEIICSDIKFLDSKEQGEKLKKNSKKSSSDNNNNEPPPNFDDQPDNFNPPNGDDDIPF